MFRTLMAIAAFTLITSSATAHEIWLERDGGDVRIYVGDVTGERDVGEDIAKLVPVSKLFTDDPARAFPVSAHPDHLSGTVPESGDVRYYNDQVWAPWANRDGGYSAAAFQARAGRSEMRAVHDFELVPLEAGADVFTLVFNGQPLAGHAVTVITPDLWEKTFKTDASGQITVPVSGAGLYVLVARHEVTADIEIAGKAVTRLQHITSLSFVAE